MIRELSNIKWLWVVACFALLSLSSCSKDDDARGRYDKELSEQISRTDPYVGSVWEGSYVRSADRKEILLRIALLPLKYGALYPWTLQLSDDGGQTYQDMPGGYYMVGQNGVLILRANKVSSDMDKWGIAIYTWELSPMYGLDSKIIGLRHHYTFSDQVPNLSPITFPTQDSK